MVMIVVNCDGCDLDRDSVSLFKEKIHEDGNYPETDTDHFENIQSTNWQTMRFKPPPPGDSIGRSIQQ